MANKFFQSLLLIRALLVLVIFFIYLYISKRQLASKYKGIEVINDFENYRQRVRAKYFQNCLPI